MSSGKETTARVDTWWSLFRWRLATWMLYRGLRIAPDGSAAIALEYYLGYWAAACRVQWHLRYPYPKGTGDVAE